MSNSGQHGSDTPTSSEVGRVLAAGPPGVDWVAVEGELRAAFEASGRASADFHLVTPVFTSGGNRVPGTGAHALFRNPSTGVWTFGLRKCVHVSQMATVELLRLLGLVFGLPRVLAYDGDITELGDAATGWTVISRGVVPDLAVVPGGARCLFVPSEFVQSARPGGDYMQVLSAVRAGVVVLNGFRSGGLGHPLWTAAAREVGGPYNHPLWVAAAREVGRPYNGGGAAIQCVKCLDTGYDQTVIDDNYVDGDDYRYCDCEYGNHKEEYEAHWEMRRERGSLEPSPTPPQLDSGDVDDDALVMDVGPSRSDALSVEWQEIGRVQGEDSAGGTAEGDDDMVMVCHVTGPDGYCPYPVCKWCGSVEFCTCYWLGGALLVDGVMGGDTIKRGSFGSGVQEPLGTQSVSAAPRGVTVGDAFSGSAQPDSVRLGIRGLFGEFGLPPERPYIVFPVPFKVGTGYVPGAVWIDQSPGGGFFTALLSRAFTGLEDGVPSLMRVFEGEHLYSPEHWKRYPVLVRNALNDGRVPHPVPSFPRLGMDWLDGCMGQHFALLASICTGEKTVPGSDTGRAPLALEPISGAVYAPDAGDERLGEPVLYMPPVHTWCRPRDLEFGKLAMEWRDRWLVGVAA